MKKKILIGTAFTALILLSMLTISTVQSRSIPATNTQTDDENWPEIFWKANIKGTIKLDRTPMRFLFDVGYTLDDECAAAITITYFDGTTRVETFPKDEYYYGGGYGVIPVWNSLPKWTNTKFLWEVDVTFYLGIYNEDSP